MLIIAAADAAIAASLAFASHAISHYYAADAIADTPIRLILADAFACRDFHYADIFAAYFTPLFSPPLPFSILPLFTEGRH